MPHNHSWSDDAPPSPGLKRFPVKLFEIRDRATFMPVMAVRLNVRHFAERSGNEDYIETWLLQRAGYGAEAINGVESTDPYVILVKLDGVEAKYDPFEWHNRRTLHVAHLHIIAHWDELKSGDLIDVEFLLGETPQPKKTERSHR